MDRGNFGKLRSLMADPNDNVQLFPADPDDDAQLFPLGWKPKESKKLICHLKALLGRREKCVPKPTR